MHQIACMYVHVHRSTYQSESVSTCQSYDSLKAMVSASRKLIICDTQYHTATIMSTKPSRQKSTPSSIIHPGKLCGPCCLCQKSQSTYRHLTNMQEELVRYRICWPLAILTVFVVAPLCQLKTSISTCSHSLSMCLYGRVDDVLAG